MLIIRDDLRTWANYRRDPSEADARSMRRTVGSQSKTDELLKFGIRPLARIDFDTGQLGEGPYEAEAFAPAPSGMLVDTLTGYHFDYVRHKGLELCGPFEFIHGLKMRGKASRRASELPPFEQYDMPTGTSWKWGLAPPLRIRVSSQEQLRSRLSQLRKLFKSCSARRLWLRGQTREYFVDRSPDLSRRLYGVSREISLISSAGRYAIANPEKVDFGFAFAGPNHSWKKPFLIWLMRENAHWFARSPKTLDHLMRVLCDDDDENFARTLMAIQFDSQTAGLDKDILWPEQADDLRQWFFGFMKPHAFAVTMQQYGYVTSLLDVTTSLDVALYFTQARMIDGRMRKQEPASGRVVYVLAEPREVPIFRHGAKIYWGDSNWVRGLPPRLDLQKAGFMIGATSRAQNMYANLVVAVIHLDDTSIQTTLSDEDLFPSPDNDLLFDTLLRARPVLEGLY